MTRFDAISIADIVEDHTRREQSAQLIINSDSMWPLLKKGDSVELAGVPGERLVAGSIVTVRDPEDRERLLTHRLFGKNVGRAGGQVFTRGDCILRFDAPIPLGDVLGEVIWRERDGRRLFLNQGPGTRLSQKLGSLAEAERRFVSGVQLDGRHVSASIIEEADRRVIERRDRWQAQLLRRVNRWRRRSLVSLNELMTLELYFSTHESGSLEIESS